MRFGDGEIDAFLTIGHAKVNLDGRGLVHISGESDETAADSNGAGKSSIGDALAWCLWGTTARDVSGDDVVNTSLGKGTRVAWKLFDGADVYEIIRHRKFPKLKNALQVFANGNEITKGTTPETQKLIEKILGCSEEVFNAAVYAGQEAMPDLPGMTDKNLKTLVEQAAGVDVLARAYETARERMRDASLKRADAQMTLDRATDRHAQTRDHIARQTVSREAWDDEQVPRIANARQAAIDAATNAAAENKKLDPNEIAGIETAMGAARSAINAVAGEQVRERELAGDVQRVVAAKSSVAQALAGQESTVVMRLRMIDNAKAQVTSAERYVEQVKAGVGRPCDDCGRPLEAAHLNTAIANAVAKVEVAKNAVTQAETAHAEAVVARDATAKKVPQVDKLLTAAEKALTDHRTSMTDISMENDRLASLQRELQLVQHKHREVERMIVAARQLNEDFKRIGAETNPYVDMLTQLDAELVKFAAAQKEALEAVKEADVAVSYASAVVDVFAPAGVRAHRLDEATPFLNERTAHYLGSLTDGIIEAYWTTLTLSKSGKDLQERFSIAVEKQGSAPSFKNLSGGEKRKVRLSCFLALQDLVASRATKSLELFVGDEIDDALDDAGLERLMGVLEEKARDRGTVMVISHNDIGAYCRNTMIVTKKNNVSTVRTA